MAQAKNTVKRVMSTGVGAVGADLILKKGSPVAKEKVKLLEDNPYIIGGVVGAIGIALRVYGILPGDIAEVAEGVALAGLLDMGDDLYKKFNK